MWENFKSKNIIGVSTVGACILLEQGYELQTTLVYIYDIIADREDYSVACILHTTTITDV
jgi:hypothetical protein